MKSLLRSLSAFLLVLFLTLPASVLRAQDDQGGGPGPGADDQGASFQTFYDQLGSQGTWVQTDNYGYVWQPQVNDPNWAPYTEGHWVYTDDGWTWDSDESFGWATYHYGRWANIDGTGWVWVPGYRWAPAWVSWRYGGGYAGWAPLPPETVIGAEYGDGGGGFHFGNDVDVSFGIGAGLYNFVEIGYLGEPNYRGHYVNRYNNYGIINRTRNITNINININNARNGGGNRNAFAGVRADGPPLNEVNARSQRRIETMQLTRSAQPGRATANGNSLAVYAPRVDPATRQQARPASVGRTISQPSFNRGTSIDKPLEVRNGLRPQAASPAEVAAAHTAEAQAPAAAKINRGNEPLRHTVTTPLTSMPATGDRRADANGGNAVNRPQTLANPAANSANPAGNDAADRAARQAEREQQHTQTQANSVVNPANNNANDAAEKAAHEAQREQQKAQANSASAATAAASQNEAKARQEKQSADNASQRDTEREQRQAAQRQQEEQQKAAAPREAAQPEREQAHIQAPAESRPESHSAAPAEHHTAAPAAAAPKEHAAAAPKAEPKAAPAPAPAPAAPAAAPQGGGHKDK